MVFWHTLPYVHRFLLGLGAAFLLNLLMQGLPAQYAVLVPDAVLHGFELWRLITYPLFGAGFWELLSASLVLYFFGPEVEHILRPGRFLRMTLLFVLAHGILFTLLMQGSTVALEDPSAYALALLAVFAYVYPNAEFSLFGIISLRAWVFAAIFAAFAVLPGLIAVIGGNTPFIVFITGDMAGILGGLLFAHLYFRKYSIPSPGDMVRSRSTISQPSRPVTPVVKRTRTEYSPLKGKSMQSSALYPDDNELSLDEQRLNDILDKISEHGRASLSDEEEQFLDEYSRRL